MTRRQRRASWGRLVAKQARSSLRAAAFCDQHRLNLHQFYRWRRRLRNDEADGNLAPGFLEFVPYSPRGQSGIRIRFGPEFSIEVDPDFDPSTLRGRQRPWPKGDQAVLALTGATRIYLYRPRVT